MKSMIKRLESDDEAKKYEVLEEVVIDLTYLIKSLKEAAAEIGNYDDSQKVESYGHWDVEVEP
jgi:hypothetical protein